MIDVFVYGTLTDPERADAVLDEFDYRGPAVLDGLHRVDGDYPTLASGGTVRGRILATDDVATLDSYEGVESGLYVRVSIPVSSDDPDAHQDDIETYVGDPELLDAPVEWPGDGPFAERVRSYARDHDVVIVFHGPSSAKMS